MNHCRSLIAKDNDSAARMNFDKLARVGEEKCSCQFVKLLIA